MSFIINGKKQKKNSFVIFDSEKQKLKLKSLEGVSSILFLVCYIVIIIINIVSVFFCPKFYSGRF